MAQPGAADTCGSRGPQGRAGRWYSAWRLTPGVEEEGCARCAPTLTAGTEPRYQVPQGSVGPDLSISAGHHPGLTRAFLTRLLCFLSQVFLKLWGRRTKAWNTPAPLSMCVALSSMFPTLPPWRCPLPKLWAYCRLWAQPSLVSHSLPVLFYYWSAFQMLPWNSANLLYFLTNPTNFEAEDPLVLKLRRQFLLISIHDVHLFNLF